MKADNLNNAGQNYYQDNNQVPNIFSRKLKSNRIFEYTLKLIQSLPGMPNKVTEEEVNSFLETKHNLQLATIDEDGYPSIQPIWFLFDKESGKIYISTQKTTRKARNLYKNSDKIYFSIDDESFPYKGVKGRGVARISEDIDWNRPIIEKIIVKYLGTMENPLAQMILENAKKGIQVVIEITPKFFSAWDFGKSM
jgi:PPOX class probable F420-dependent enzyme